MTQRMMSLTGSGRKVNSDPDSQVVRNCCTGLMAPVSPYLCDSPARFLKNRSPGLFFPLLLTSVACNHREPNNTVLSRLSLLISSLHYQWQHSLVSACFIYSK